jgi:Cytochrome c7 and related cytochrome c
MNAALVKQLFSLTLLCCILASAGLAACARPPEPAFPHLAHLTGVGCGKPGTAPCLDCNSCHSISDHGATRARTDTSLCVRCHGGESQRVAQRLEQTKFVHAEVGFNHDQHLAMNEVQGQCVVCHGGVLKQGSSPLPAMSQCFTCHEHQDQWNAGKCSPCHTANDLSRTLPISFLRHDQEFARHHGQFAVEDKRLCQSCHTQKQCNDCHDVSQDLTRERRQPEKIAATTVHGGDFLVRHPIEAQAEPARCARCHTPESCDSCHLQRGVSGIGLNARNPHPTGWVGSNANSSSSHGREARRDILLCASCHDQGPATNCIRCHKVGGYGGNPHPNGWRSARSPEQGMCRYCHE